ncbi:hypothetical protein GUJ93_ZPchr0010g10950 [Zizania palustris]|uniref:Uncharacterized protein n=1 Tax=Zizania palustris TaxID=103762 RepID=A0A8J5WAF6_ZIZPA|nr:hypothetical protein GUJ93_ZPchr0010g10950 [Zizania palustris]
MPLHNAAETNIELIGTSKLSPTIPFFSSKGRYGACYPSGYELGWLYSWASRVYQDCDPKWILSISRLTPPCSEILEGP